jgi:1-acyl-sn-glycerol-3-phosphate acyltransferase
MMNSSNRQSKLISLGRGLVSLSILFVNTIFWTLLLYPLALLKFLIPPSTARKALSHAMVAIAERWIAGNNLNLNATQKIFWQIQLPQDLSLDKSYLVFSNHQSWTDILVLQRALNRQIPFLRFFLKQELIWVPFLGPAWWALDYPFMKRYSREYLERHPHKRGHDLETTRRTCQRFKGTPISILNFLEGTRFTQKKHAKQGSPYHHLLRPKAGGIAFVLESMGDQFDCLLDVTIQYPNGRPTFWQLMSGQVTVINVSIQKIKIPREFVTNIHADYRERLHAWINSIWLQKDQELDNNLKATNLSDHTIGI